MLVTAAAVAPDLDGMGVVWDFLARNSGNPFEFYQRFHHVFGHNVFFALLISCLAFLPGVRTALVSGLMFVSFHTHLLGDIIGARGRGDDFWPVPYFWPLSNAGLVWSGQWPLNGWQNFTITGVLLGLAFYWAWKRGRSPLEMISQRIDGAFVAALRSRFGFPLDT